MVVLCSLIPALLLGGLDFHVPLTSALLIGLVSANEIHGKSHVKFMHRQVVLPLLLPPPWKGCILEELLL